MTNGIGKHEKQRPARPKKKKVRGQGQEARREVDDARRRAAQHCGHEGCVIVPRRSAARHQGRGGLDDPGAVASDHLIDNRHPSEEPAGDTHGPAQAPRAYATSRCPAAW